MVIIFTEEERRELAGRARTLDERIDGPVNTLEGDPDIDPEEVLTAWEAVFPDASSFQKRLSLEGLTESTVREQIAATHWPPASPLPDWIDQLERLNQHVENTRIGECEVDTESTDVPFVELLTAIADFAYEKLPEEIIRTNAVSPLVDWLLLRLERVSTRPLYIEFMSYVEHHDPELIDADPEEFENPPTTYYERFIDGMFGGGFRDVCLEYPVLARHIVRLIDYWEDAVTEVYERIEDDRIELQETFDIEGNVTALEPLADDTHARGRVPIRVSFESGEVIYKPRAVAAGKAFSTILDRLNGHLSIPSFRTPTYLPRENYGWMESIEYRDPTDERGVERYYERAGAMLCIAYALNLTDCHYENLVVEENNPVIIDAETLFHHHADLQIKPVKPELFHAITPTVLKTSLLPVSGGNPNAISDGESTTSIAGFGHDSERVQTGHVSHPIVEAVNTDVMTIGTESPVIDRSANTPTVNGTDQPPEEYVNDVVHGFEETYDRIRELHSNGTLFSDVINEQLAEDIENRLINRLTEQYDLILRSATAQKPLQNGAWLSVELAKLAAPLFDDHVDTDRCWPLYVAERKALSRLDIPRFTSYPNRETVFHDDEPVADIVGVAGYENCRETIEDMDSTDCRRQIWLIRQCLEKEEPTTSTSTPVEITEETLQEEALDMVESTVDAAIDIEGSKRWVSIMRTDPISLVPAGSSLYYGRSGVALTAAALYHTTNHDRYRDLAEEILDSVIREYVTDDDEYQLGGTIGAGSVVYVLSVVAELLDEERYQRVALEVAQSIPVNRLSDGAALDVMEGVAGTLLGLLAYHDRFGGQTILDRARRCGDHLLEARTNVAGYQVWKTGQYEPILSFAHGTSGITYALSRLSGSVDESQYARAAKEGFAFEQEFSSDVQNPSECHSEQHNRGPLDWCHGQAGIALSRIGMGKYLDDARIVADADSRLAEVLSTGQSPFDNVCCGNFARVEAVLAGRKHTDRCDVRTAFDLTEKFLSRRRDDGTLNLPGHSETFINPTFFNGVSGVAYTLLRLCKPNSLPSVLLLE